MEDRFLPNILFVDDDEDFEFLIRQKFRKKLTDGVWHIEFARNGKEALQKIESNPEIHVVFTDLNMPVMDGLTFLGELSEHNRQNTRSVVVSAYGEMENIRKAMNRGAFDFLVKPINFEDLVITLEKSISEVKQIRAGLQARQNLENAIVEKKAAEETDRLRQQFFANITHELRTPLTLILGPAEQLMEEFPELTKRHHLSSIRNNAQKLQNLIDQLLDLARIDAGGMDLALVRDNLSEFIQGIWQEFEPAAQTSSIQYHLHKENTPLICDFDPDKVTAVLQNLLSNAFKYVSNQGEIKVTIEDLPETVEITVSNSGKGIPADELPFIFDRFYRVRTREYQTSAGTGIGLAYARELARIMGGTLFASSEPNGITQFVFRLPKLKYFGKEEIPPSLADNKVSIRKIQLDSSLQEFISTVEEVEEITESEAQTVVLIVEDNPEIRRYIRSVLDVDFRVMEAENGKQGLEKSRELVPDIIVSDVMMPEMDGFEMCRQLREDERTSHIPLILLTAKVGTESKLAGLSRGADAFLEKPFNHLELKTRIQGLVTLRQQLSVHYRREILKDSGEVEAESMDSAFARRIRKSLEDHLEDESFSVEELALEVGMSRTQLHRKITALTGESAGKFIRAFRLNTARELLVMEAGNIAEIAFKVGFSSPSYFTKCFREEFGYSPKEAKSQSK